MLSILAIGLAVALPSWAEIEEIVVTATKREENVQDIPIAVTALSDVQLERAGVKDLRDLAQISPSFNMNTSQTESQGATMRIRGVGTTGNNIGLESAVGVFLDGVYLSRPGIALGDLLDVERLEVLRGPQGTLFGRNTSAGALSVVTKKPNLEEQEYWVNATVGNYDAYNVQAGASFPLIADQLGLRVSGAYRKQDGFATSTTGGESYNRDRFLLRGQLYWTPNEDLSVRFIADYSAADENCCDGGQVQETTLLSLYPLAGLPANGGNPNSGSGAFTARKTNSNDEFRNDFDQWGVSVEVNYALTDDITVTYIGSYRDFHATSFQDDFTGLDVYSVPDSFDDIKSTTHELRIQGVSDRIDWMAGFYWGREKIEEKATLTLQSDYQRYIDVPAWFGGILAFVPPAALGIADVNQAFEFAGNVDAAGSFATNDFRQDGRSWSLFTHNTIHVTDTVDVVLGARWIDESKDGKFDQIAASSPACLNTIANTAASLLNGTPLAGLAIGFACFPFATQADVPGLSGIVPQTFDKSFDDSELTYTGKIVWAFLEDATAYASFTHGFKAGGFNLDSTAAIGGADPRFKSELVDSIEVGMKSIWLDDTLRVNASLFQMEMEDFQVLEFTGIQFQTFNVAKVKSTGAEIETLWAPIEGLTISMGGTLANARYPVSCSGGPVAPAQVLSLCGFPLTNAPKWVGSVGINWEDEVPGTDMTYFVNASLLHQSDRRTGTQPRDPTSLVLSADDIQQDNSKVNLRVGVTDAEGKWSVEVWGNNIFDRQTKNVTFNIPLRGVSSLGSAARGVFYEAPRTYGLTLRWKY